MATRGFSYSGWQAVSLRAPLLRFCAGTHFGHSCDDGPIGKYMRAQARQGSSIEATARKGREDALYHCRNSRRDRISAGRLDKLVRATVAVVV